MTVLQEKHGPTIEEKARRKYFQFQIYTILKYMAFNSTGRKQCEQENGTFNLIIEDFSNLVQDMKYFLSN